MRKFGIELEGIGMSQCEVADLLRANGIPCHNEGYTHDVMRKWKVVWDQTLQRSASSSFELVSPPLEGEAGIAEVERVVKLVNNAGAGVNRDCGIHVHVDMNNAKPRHIANVYNRYRDFEEVIDAFMPVSRRGNNNTMIYSLKDSAKLAPRSTARATVQQRSNRYCKVNLKSFITYGTMEFRHHSGSFNVSKVTSWIKFLLQFVDASEVEAPGSAQHPGLPPKLQAVVDYIDSNAPRNAAALAQGIGSTADSVYTMISMLRARGWNISKFQGRYVCSGGQLRSDASNAPALPSKLQSVVDYIEANRPTRAVQIAWGVQSTADSVYTMISTLRRKGYTIDKDSAGAYAVGHAPAAGDDDTLWRGVDDALKTYYARRTSVLAS